jgi:GTP-binding protein
MVPADTDRNISAEYNILLNELEEFNPELLDKPRVLAISKGDLIDEDLEKLLRPTLPEGIPTIFISAMTNKNLQALKDMLWKILSV